MSQLIPEVIVDKNGRTTTVYKRERSEKRNVSNLFGVLPRSSDPSRTELVRAVKDEIRDLTSESFEGAYSSSLSKTWTRNLQGVLNILRDGPASKHTLDVIAERAETADNKARFNEWLASFVTHFNEMKQWPSGSNRPAEDNIIASLLADVLRSQKADASLGHDEAMETARLTCALSSTGLSPFAFRPTPYGLAFFADNDYLRVFTAANHENKELMDTAVALLVSKKLNRVEDLAGIASGELPTAFAEGAL